jgi:hypothetical protein
MIYNDGAGIEISDDEPVVVIDVQYFEKLVKLLDKTKNRVIGTKLYFILAKDDSVEQQATLIFFKNHLRVISENYMYWRALEKFRTSAFKSQLLQVFQKKPK